MKIGGLMIKTGETSMLFYTSEFEPIHHALDCKMRGSLMRAPGDNMFKCQSASVVESILYL